jgi:hypothetical protein
MIYDMFSEIKDKKKNIIINSTKTKKIRSLSHFNEN